MRRYLVFAFNTYYPKGGINDLSNSFHTLDIMLRYLQSLKRDGGFEHAQVYDIETGEITKYSLISGEVSDGEHQLPSETVNLDPIYGPNSKLSKGE